MDEMTRLVAATKKYLASGVLSLRPTPAFLISPQKIEPQRTQGTQGNRKAQGNCSLTCHSP